MIGDFIGSWNLFHHAYLAGWILAMLLALVGVIVVARDQIFLGAAVAQSSTLGIAVAMWVGSLLPAHHGEHESHGPATAVAILFSMLAALFTTRGHRFRRESREAITGWIFLFASSSALLVVAQSPLGLEEIQRLLSSSLIGANAFDVWGFSALALVTALVIWKHHDRLTLLATDPVMASAVGLHVARWETGLALWLGLTVGFAIHSSGLLYTFGCLVLPALIAKQIAREIRSMYWLAPVIALLCSIAGFVLANRFDAPPAQSAVSLMATILGAYWLLARRNSNRTG